MKKVIAIISIVAVGTIIFSSTGNALNKRIYCKPSGIIIEHRVDESYSEENKTHDLAWFVVNEDDIPSYMYIEQLGCSGNGLAADLNYKPVWVVHKEQIEQAQAALDAELGKAEPDVITVLRLQRSIELLKSGK